MERQKVDERYKMNSTSGGSLINPISYKGDVMVQVWMDSRVLATLCKWLENEGEYPRFLSHVVRVPLEMLIDSLVADGKAEMVDDTLEARTLLKGRFHVNLNKGRKGRKNLLHNVTLSSRRGTDMGSRVRGGIDYTKYDVEEPVEMLSQEETRAKYFKEEARKKRALKDVAEADIEKARSCGMIVEGENKEERITKLVETDHRLEEIKSELPELSQEEVVAKFQAEQKGETFAIEKGVSVKEDMSDGEYEVMMKNREKRDKERLELENAPFEASDLDIVSEDGNEGE